MKRWLVYGVAILVLSTSGTAALSWWTSKRYQQCADATRMADLFTIAQMIEDYHTETGRYPFQPTDDRIVEALLASRDLTEAERKGTSQFTTVLDRIGFYDELERILGAGRVQRLTDPQKVADDAPHFYQYRAVRDAYYVSVNLFEAVPQSIELGPRYHKVQLGSILDEKNKIYPFLEVPTGSILAASVKVAESCS